MRSRARPCPGLGRKLGLVWVGSAACKGFEFYRGGFRVFRVIHIGHIYIYVSCIGLGLGFRVYRLSGIYTGFI